MVSRLLTAFAALSFLAPNAAAKAFPLNFDMTPTVYEVEVNDYVVSSTPDVKERVQPAMIRSAVTYEKLEELASNTSELENVKLRVLFDVIDQYALKTARSLSTEITDYLSYLSGESEERPSFEGSSEAAAEFNSNLAVPYAAFVSQIARASNSILDEEIFHRSEELPTAVGLLRADKTVVPIKLYSPEGYYIHHADLDFLLSVSELFVVITCLGFMPPSGEGLSYCEWMRSGCVQPGQ